jgi:hypothetical protein
MRRFLRIIQTSLYVQIACVASLTRTIPFGALPLRKVTLANLVRLSQFIVMFRSRFNDAFPQKLVHFGPQDIERGVVDQTPSPQVEALLCALLGLVLNRKKPVE